MAHFQASVLLLNDHFKTIISDQLLEFDPSLPYTIELDATYIEEDVPTPGYDVMILDATDNDMLSKDTIDGYGGYMVISNRSGKAIGVAAPAKDSGKNVYSEFIMSVFRDPYAVKAIDPDKLNGRFSFGDVQGVSMVCCTDMNTDRLKKSAVSALKQVSGNSFIRSEAKLKKEQTVKITFKTLLCTNSGIFLPVGSQDDAFYRRIIVLPFVKSTPIEKIDESLREKLQQDKSAIVSKWVRGLRKRINPKTGGITLYQSTLSRKIKERWMNLNYCTCDRSFIDDCLTPSSNPEDALAKEEIYTCYRTYFDKYQLDRPNASMITSNALVTMIRDIYPQVSAKPLRRGVVQADGKHKKVPCLTNLQWKTKEN